MRILLTIPCLLISLYVMGQKADPRARLHYSAEEIAQIEKDPARLEKVNYLFGQSFEIVPSDSAHAAPVDVSAINVMQYDFHRYAEERRTIYLTRNHDKIILHSRQEVEKKYKEIEAKYR